MRIGLDYDGTYTLDPEMWGGFVKHAKAHGHEVWVVTMRTAAEGLDIGDLALVVDGVEFTSRKAKKNHMNHLGLPVDIWIDDMPVFINEDAWQG